MIDLSGAHLLARSFVRSAAGTHAHALALEPRGALLGRPLYAQALILGEGLVLTNAVDLLPGR